MRFSLVVIAVLALGAAACAPADAVLDGDIEAAGMEPAFWGVKVSREKNTSEISVLGEADFSGPAPVKAKTPEGLVTLTTATPRGDFVMVLKNETCLNGLDNKVQFDWSVTVDWQGETLSGCAKAIAKAAK